MVWPLIAGAGKLAWALVPKSFFGLLVKGVAASGLAIGYNKIANGDYNNTGDELAAAAKEAVKKPEQTLEKTVEAGSDFLTSTDRFVRKWGEIAENPIDSGEEFLKTKITEIAAETFGVNITNNNTTANNSATPTTPTLTQTNNESGSFFDAAGYLAQGELMKAAEAFIGADGFGFDDGAKIAASTLGPMALFKWFGGGKKDVTTNDDSGFNWGLASLIGLSFIGFLNKDVIANKLGLGNETNDLHEALEI